MKMADLSEFLDQEAIDRTEPLQLAHIAHVLDRIKDEVLLDYAKSGILNDPGSLESLMLVDAFVKELTKRDKDAVGGVYSLVKQEKPLSEIVEQSALILSGAIPNDEYRQILKSAEEGIIKDIRKTQFEQIKRRLKPFTPYTSLQFHARMAIATALCLAVFSLLTFRKYSNYAELIEYAKQHKAYYEEVSRDESIEDVLSKASEAHKFLPSEITYASIDRGDSTALAAIDIINVLVGDEGNTFRRELVQEKIGFYDRFISEREGTAAGLLGEYRKGRFIDDAKALFGLSQEGIDLMISSLEKGKDYIGLFHEQHILEIAKSVRELSFAQYGEKERADNDGITFLKEFAQRNAGTNIGDVALSFVAGLYSPERKFYSPGRCFVKVENIFEELGSYRWFSSIDKNPDESIMFYEELRSKSRNPDYYGGVEYLLAFRESKKVRKNGNMAEKYSLINRFLAVAGTVDDQTTGDLALIEVGKLYINMRLYEKGNDYLQFVIDRNEDNKSMRYKAKDEQVNIGWNKFWDNL